MTAVITSLESPANQTLRHLPALDGLRAISVLIVAASHCGFGSFVPGGLGVTIFFFLSGFLITTLLHREYQLNQTIALGKFFIRRFTRLAPAFFFTLLIADGLTSSGLLAGHLSIVGFLAQAFYFANYFSVFFDNGLNTADGTGVFWSLAVEEHFYLIYPLIASIFLFKLSKKLRAITLLTICVVVLGWRCYLSLNFINESERIYYCTDTRLDSILFGCIFATLFPDIDSQKNDTDARRSAVLLIVGMFILFVSLLVRAPIFRDTARYTLQGFALFPIFYALLTTRARILQRAFNCYPLSKLGEISYSFYLIHFIVVKFLTKNSSIAENRLALYAAVLTVSIAYAVFTTAKIERPIRRWITDRGAVRPLHIVTIRGDSPRIK